MKRYGHIVEEAATFERLSDSFDYVLRGTRRKSSRSGRMLIENRDAVIEKLRNELLTGTFTIGDMRTFHITERGKEREIQSIPLDRRIALNAVMTVMEKRIYRSTIADTAASIKGRGGLYLHKRIRQSLKDNPSLRWFYKCDIRKFYHSIDRDLMMDVARRTFKDSLLLGILQQCIYALPYGISIGLRSSQSLANLLLSIYIDHEVKERAGWKYYWRYCDDIVVGGESKYELTGMKDLIHECVESAHLEIKPTEQVFCIADRPLDFLGYRIYEDGHIAIRKHIKQRFARRWNRVRSRRRKVELIGSFYGIAKHADAKNLFKTLTGYNMKDFSELGIKYVAQDGKKRFECATAKLDDIQNTHIIVKDFETGIKTREGDDRYVVLFEDESGVERKFFTASEEMKQLLDKIRSLGEIPFRTVIRRKNFGDGKKKYCFT